MGKCPYPNVLSINYGIEHRKPTTTCWVPLEPPSPAHQNVSRLEVLNLNPSFSKIHKRRAKTGMGKNCPYPRLAHTPFFSRMHNLRTKTFSQNLTDQSVLMRVLYTISKGRFKRINIEEMSTINQGLTNPNPNPNPSFSTIHKRKARTGMGKCQFCPYPESTFNPPLRRTHNTYNHVLGTVETAVPCTSERA